MFAYKILKQEMLASKLVQSVSEKIQPGLGSLTYVDSLMVESRLTFLWLPFNMKVDFASNKHFPRTLWLQSVALFSPETDKSRDFLLEHYIGSYS